MSFEIFKDTRLRTKEYISVTENKTFGLPRTFLDKQKITGNHKAVIFFDPDANKIALHFTLEDPKFGLAVRVPNEKQGATVVAKSFFESKSIDVKKYSGRYHDFQVVELNDLGDFHKDGVAYVIQLVENNSEPVRPTVNSNEIIIEEIDDTPINLEDIPF